MHDKILSQIITMKLVSLRTNFKDNTVMVKQNSSVLYDLCKSRYCRFIWNNIFSGEYNDVSGFKLLKFGNFLFKIF